MSLEPKKLKRAVVKEEYVALTGDFIKAVLLNQFIYWSERIKDVDQFIFEESERAAKHGENANVELQNGWFYKKAEELAEETMLGLAPSGIRRHVQYLVEMGWILERQNPKYKWDRTKQYRVNFLKLQQDLRSIGYELQGYTAPISKIENAISKIENGESKIENQSVENRTAIPEIINKDYLKENDDEDDTYSSHQNTISELSPMQLLFNKLITKYKINDHITASILNELNKTTPLDKCDPEALERSFTKLINRVKNQSISNPTRWFIQTLENEQFTLEQANIQKQEFAESEKRWRNV